MPLATVRIILDAPSNAQQLIAALTGPGGPGAVRAAINEGGVLHVGFDDALCSETLIRDFIEIHARALRSAARPLTADEAVRVVARALNAPEIDELRVLETQLEGLA